MRNIRFISSVALLGIGLIGLSTTGASARIACNEEGDCWHTTTTYEYPSAAHVIVHGDDWKWGDGDHYAWREHEGRGYWHNHAWTDF